MDRNDVVFVVGLLKGAVEGDAYAHFGSILAIRYHEHNAVDAGLITVGDERNVATERGLDFYRRHRLRSLPPGRAYLWRSEDVATAVAELELTIVT